MSYPTFKLSNISIRPDTSCLTKFIQALDVQIDLSNFKEKSQISLGKKWSQDLRSDGWHLERKCL